MVADTRAKGQSIAFVPTMGALHEGHLTLIDEAKRVADVVVMSIFVNPLQFGPSEDFGRYPRMLDEDAKLAAERGVDFLFTPSEGGHVSGARAGDHRPSRKHREGMGRVRYGRIISRECSPSSQSSFTS